MECTKRLVTQNWALKTPSPCKLFGMHITKCLVVPFYASKRSARAIQSGKCDFCKTAITSSLELQLRRARYSLESLSKIKTLVDLQVNLDIILIGRSRFESDSSFGLTPCHVFTIFFNPNQPITLDDIVLYDAEHFQIIIFETIQSLQVVLIWAAPRERRLMPREITAATLLRRST